jgi:MFS family permease
MIQVENTIVYMYIIIGVMYGCFIIAPYVISQVISFIKLGKGLLSMETDILNTTDTDTYDDIKTSSDLFKFITKETVYLLFSVTIAFVITYTLAFYYLLFMKDYDFNQTFVEALKLVNSFLWRDGELFQYYIPFLLAIVLVFITMTLYGAIQTEFLQRLTFPNKLENDDETNSNNKHEMLRTNFVIFVLLIVFIIFIFTFLPHWNVNKVLFLEYFFLMLLMMIITIISFTNSFGYVYFYIALCFSCGVHLYISAKK